MVYIEMHWTHVNLLHQGRMYHYQNYLFFYQQILKYLVASDRLCELGYDEAQVEEALEMFQNCESKVIPAPFTCQWIQKAAPKPCLNLTGCLTLKFCFRLPSSCVSSLSLMRWASNKMPSKKCCSFMKIIVRGLLKNSWHAWLKAEHVLISSPHGERIIFYGMCGKCTKDTKQIMPSNCAVNICATQPQRL